MTLRQSSDIRYLLRMNKFKPHGLYYRVRCSNCDKTQTFGKPLKAIGFIRRHEDHDTGFVTSRAPMELSK